MDTSQSLQYSLHSPSRIGAVRPWLKSHLAHMAPKRTPPLIEGALPDGRTFRLVLSGSRLFMETFVGTKRELKQHVPHA